MGRKEENNLQMNNLFQYHIDRTEVSSLGFGKIPESSTSNSNDRHSRLQRKRRNKNSKLLIHQQSKTIVIRTHVIILHQKSKSPYQTIIADGAGHHGQHDALRLQEACEAGERHERGERRDRPPRVRAGLRGDVGVLADGEQDVLGARPRDGDGDARQREHHHGALLVHAEEAILPRPRCTAEQCNLSALTIIVEIIWANTYLKWSKTIIDNLSGNIPMQPLEFRSKQYMHTTHLKP
jgi:hypothetical protein